MSGCSECHGKGFKGLELCKRCRGSGFVDGGVTAYRPGAEDYSAHEIEAGWDEVPREELHEGRRRKVA